MTTANQFDRVRIPATEILHAFKPLRPGQQRGNYEQFVKHQERRISRGIGGLTYEKYTGNLSGVNYSSIRAGNLEFQRQCKQFIFNVMAYQICRPVARYWLSQVALSNAMFLPGYARDPKSYLRIKWTIDGWPWVDPLKNLKASTGLVRSGFFSQ